MRWALARSVVLACMSVSQAAGIWAALHRALLEHLEEVEHRD